MDLLCDAFDEEELLDKQLTFITPRFHYTRQWMVNARYYISTLEEDLEICEAANAATEGGFNNDEASDAHS